MGKVDWEQLFRGPEALQRRHLSLRGRNLFFLERLASALNLKAIPKRGEFVQFKRAFTPEAVREIHEAIPELWQDSADLAQCLEREGDAVSGLYCGSYEPSAVFQAVSRHALYAERIVLPDPFLYHVNVREDFSPVLHPEQYRAVSIKCAYLWFAMAPWVHRGMVAFVRTPGDLDATLFREFLDLEHEKIEGNADLKRLLDDSARETVRLERGKLGGPFEHFLLSHPDEALRKKFHDMPADRPWKTEDEFMAEIERRRNVHPYYVPREPGQNREMLIETTGASYEEAKRTCAMAGYHLVTDLASKWKELELDHANATEAMQVWSPFAKALQNARVTVLDDIPLEAALRLREEKRLESMRHFFNRVWRESKDADQYSATNAANLAAELDTRVAEADEEWKRIDRDLLKWLGGGVGTLLSAGMAGFFPVGMAAAGVGVGALAVAAHRRSSFARRYPAGFFLRSKVRGT